MKTCLIVEDSALIREVAARIVKDLGLAAHEADSAEAALASMREARPDVVLLDWDLPTLAALDFLRGAAELEGARPPIVLAATEYDHQQFALAKAAGAAFHVLKPYDATVVGEAFAEAGVIAAGAVPAPQGRAVS